MKPKTSRGKFVRKSLHQELVRPALPVTVNLGLLRRLGQNEPNLRAEVVKLHCFVGMEPTAAVHERMDGTQCARSE
jgi:hypothetical protein